MTPIVLASRNAHKLEELRVILAEHLPGIELLLADGPEPRETGATFEENALIKARAAAEHSGLPALADDSGIVADILGEAPGILSARWAGPERSDASNRELLLWQLNDLPDEHRSARFICAAALALPSGEAHTRRGVWTGSILRSSVGTQGFGYDPIFQPEGEDRSAAQLTPEEKNRVSHRTRAFTALVPEIRRSIHTRSTP